MCFQDFMRCVTASIIYFIVSIMAVSRYVDGSSKAAGVNSSSRLPFPGPQHFRAALTSAILLFLQIFGFIATIVFAFDFYLIFNELAAFLKEGGQTDAEPTRQRGNATLNWVHETLNL